MQTDPSLRHILSSGGDDTDVSLPVSSDEPAMEHAGEIEKLKAVIRQKDAENEALKLIVQGDQRKDYVPNERAMQGVWTIAFQSALQSVFKNGLSTWNSREHHLFRELELATIRADQTVEAYIRVRKTVAPDPTEREMNKYNKSQSTNPLKDAS